MVEVLRLNITARAIENHFHRLATFTDRGLFDAHSVVKLIYLTNRGEPLRRNRRRLEAKDLVSGIGRAEQGGYESRMRADIEKHAATFGSARDAIKLSAALGCIHEIR